MTISREQTCAPLEHLLAHRLLATLTSVSAGALASDPRGILTNTITAADLTLANRTVMTPDISCLADAE